MKPRSEVRFTAEAAENFAENHGTFPLRYLRKPRRPLRLIIALLVITSLLPLNSIIPTSAGSDREIFIRVNQLGYQPRDLKSAVAFSRETLPERFTVIDAVTQQIVFEGATKRIAGHWGEFDHQAELDFSAWQKPGKYFVRIGEATSLPFEISNSAYRDVPDELLEFMREQRCGYNPWLDAVCHTKIDSIHSANPARTGLQICWTKRVGAWTGC